MLASSMTESMIYVGAHFPKLGLEVFQAMLPDTSQPVVLVDTQRIVQLNAAAKEAGIIVNSNLATAYSLAPELVHFVRDPEKEQQQLRRLVTTLYQFSPAVSIGDASTLIVEVRGSLRLFRGLERLLEQLHERLRQRHHVVHLGVGHTPKAAIAIAKAQLPCAVKPYPTTQELCGATEQQLTRVALCHSELPAKAVERLHNMGIRSLGELLTLPKRELNTRLDNEVMTYLRQLAGSTPDILPWEEPVEQFSAQRHLLEPIRSKGELRFPMTDLLAEFRDWLDAKYQGAREIRWLFAPAMEPALDLVLRFAAPQVNQAEMLALTELRLETLDLPEDIMSVELVATQVQSQAAANVGARDMFGTPEPAAWMPHKLLDRLTTRLGKDALRVVATVDAHQPEQSLQLRPLVSEKRSSKTSAQPRSIQGRPLWLCETPHRVHRKHLELLTPAERLQGGWWQQPYARDYYVARHESGTVCWVYCEHEQWFQHGYFA